MSAYIQLPFRLITETGLRARNDIPLDHYCRINAQEMALTHNTIFRGFNAVWQHAPHVCPGTQDAADLLFYCTVVYDFIHTHHTVEETVFFPLLAEATGLPELMQENIEQHRRMEDGLEKFRRYAEQTSPSAYDSKTLRHLIETLSGPLEQHLHEEIPTILNLYRIIDSKTLKNSYKKMHDTAAAVSDKLKTAPYVFGCQDRHFLLDGRTFNFPDVVFPGLVPYIIQVAVAPWYRRLWRFNPSTFLGEPKPIHASHKETSGTAKSLVLLGFGIMVIIPGTTKYCWYLRLMIMGVLLAFARLLPVMEAGVSFITM